MLFHVATRCTRPKASSVGSRPPTIMSRRGSKCRTNSHGTPFSTMRTYLPKRRHRATYNIRGATHNMKRQRATYNIRRATYNTKRQRATGMPFRTNAGLAVGSSNGLNGSRLLEVRGSWGGGWRGGSAVVGFWHLLARGEPEILLLRQLVVGRKDRFIAHSLRVHLPLDVVHKRSLLLVIVPALRYSPRA